MVAGSGAEVPPQGGYYSLNVRVKRAKTAGRVAIAGRLKRFGSRFFTCARAAYATSRSGDAGIYMSVEKLGEINWIGCWKEVASSSDSL